MKETVFEAGDVVRLDHYLFGKHNGQLATVVKVCENEITVRTGDGLEWVVTTNTVLGVTLEELRENIGDRPAPRTLVDGLSAEELDELESGQDEAYEMFQQAAKDAEYCERVQKETKEAYNRIRRCKLYRKKEDAFSCIIGFVFATLCEIATWIIVWLQGYLAWSLSLAGVAFATLMAVYAAHHMVWLIKGIDSKIKRIDSEHTQQEGES